MDNQDKLNMKLRSYVLEHSIRQEQTSAKIIKLILRILKNKTKTLGNKSSSLSFKNKVDLLHDLGDVDDMHYNHLIKFMEIRNQFAHNHECSSFLKLGEANSELTNYLKKFKNDEKDEEESLLLSYNELFRICQTKLVRIQIEYNAGIRLDIEKFVDNETCKQIDKIIDDSVLDWNNFNNEGGGFDSFSKEQHIKNFILCFYVVWTTYRSNVGDKLPGNIENVLRRKKTIEEIADEHKKEEPPLQ
jgi:hypothetical protein